MRRLIIPFLLVVGASAGCGGAALADCDAIARDNATCMDDEAKAECEATNDACDDSSGEVLVLAESCPLQFACAADD